MTKKIKIFEPGEVPPARKIDYSVIGGVLTFGACGCALAILASWLFAAWSPMLLGPMLLGACIFLSTVIRDNMIIDRVLDLTRYNYQAKYYRFLLGRNILNFNDIKGEKKALVNSDLTIRYSTLKGVVLEGLSWWEFRPQVIAKHADVATLKLTREIDNILKSDNKKSKASA